MNQTTSSDAGESDSDTLLTDALRDKFAAYYLLCVLAVGMLEEARRQRAVADRSAD